MSTVHKRTFSLSEEQSEFIDDRVASGGYTSGSEVVRAGLRALQERDAFIERWMKEEVIPSYDQWVADGMPVLTEDEVFDGLEEDLQKVEQSKES